MGVTCIKRSVLLMMMLLGSGCSFFMPTLIQSPSMSSRRISCTTMMAQGGLQPASTAVVVGYRGGIGELVAKKLAEAHKDVRVRAILDQAEGGSSSDGSMPAGIEVVQRNLESITSSDVSGASTAFVSLDKGFSAETGADLANYVALPAILSAMPSSASILVSAYCNDTTGVNAGGGLPIKLFAKGVNPKEAVTDACSSGKNCLLVQHGRLFGQVTGQQPLPFLSGPLQKPIVEESSSKQGMLLGLGSSLARPASAATSRTVIAEAMVRSISTYEPSALKDFSVLSLEGPAPSESDWDQQLAGLDTRGGVSVFEKQLGPKERVDLPVLQDWLANDFGTTLSTLAISRVLSSPKPSVVTNTNVGSDIIWQFIEKDLSVRVSGRWCVQLDKEAATIKILRVDASGGILTEPLPGEEELLQRFSAAINRLVYSKKLSKRRTI